MHIVHCRNEFQLLLPHSDISCGFSSSGRHMSPRHSWCSAISVACVSPMQWVTLAGLQDMWNTGIRPTETGLEFDLRQLHAQIQEGLKSGTWQDLQNWTASKKARLQKMVSNKKKTLWGSVETAGRHWVHPADPRCERSSSYLLTCANLQRSPFAFSSRPNFLMSPSPPSTYPHVLTHSAL